MFECAPVGGAIDETCYHGTVYLVSLGSEESTRKKAHVIDNCK